MLKKPQGFKSKGVMTLDKLAGMMANGFSNLEERLGGRIDKLDIRVGSLENSFDSLEVKFDSLENRIDTLEDSILQKFSGLENRIDSLAEGKASREEVKVINTRLTRVEKKLAI